MCGKVLTRLGLITVFAIVLTACNSGKGSSSDESSSSKLNAASATVSKPAVRDQGITLTGPQIVMVSTSGHFVLNIPTGVTIASAAWTFSDGGTATGTNPVDYQFFTPG